MAMRAHRTGWGFLIALIYMKITVPDFRRDGWSEVGQISKLQGGRGTKDFELVRTECMGTHVVRARADVVATKLGIILLLLPSFFYFPFNYISMSKSENNYLGCV